MGGAHNSCDDWLVSIDPVDDPSSSSSVNNLSIVNTGASEGNELEYNKMNMKVFLKTSSPGCQHGIATQLINIWVQPMQIHFSIPYDCDTGRTKTNTLNL